MDLPALEPAGHGLPTFSSGDLGPVLEELGDGLGLGFLDLLGPDDLLAQPLVGATGGQQQQQQQHHQQQQQPQQLQPQSPRGTSKRISRRSSTVSSGSKRPAETALKTAESQLESQKRWRLKEKARQQDLQAEVEAKAAEAARLTALNSDLRSKQVLLEAVLAIRDDQLRTLSTGQRPQQSKQQRPLANHEADASAGAAGSTGAAQQQVLQVCTQPGGVPGQLQGQPCHLPAPPPSDKPLPPLECIPAVPLWDAAWIARLKLTTPQEWQAMWREFVKEASMHVLAAEAHGPGSSAHDMLAQVVSHSLGILDRLTLLVPTLYFDSLYINLLTGQRQEPPPGHWVTVAKALAPTHQQVREAKTALAAFDQSMAQVLAERAAITARITQHLAPTPSPASQPPAASHADPGCSAAAGAGPAHAAGAVGGTALQQGPPHEQGAAQLQQLLQAMQQEQARLAVQQQASTSTAAAAPAPATAAAAGTAPATAPQHLQQSVGGAVSGQQAAQRLAVCPQPSSHCTDLASLTHQLNSNLAKEHAAHDTVSDFLCTRVLSVVQLARAAAVSWPWMPDVTAILKEGVAALGGATS